MKTAKHNSFIDTSPVSTKLAKKFVFVSSTKSVIN